MVQNWLDTASDWALINANIGNDPSLADVIKMVHPKPGNLEREALFAWIVGRPCDVSALPEALQDWLRFKETGKGQLPDVLRVGRRLSRTTGRVVRALCCISTG